MDKVGKKLFQVTKTQLDGNNIHSMNRNDKNETFIPTIDEIDLENENITNDWIHRIVYYVKTRYYQSDFNKLIKFFNHKISKFLQRNEYILYTIMKFILFDKVRIGDIEESKKFYFEYFLHFLKKTHPKSWERKNTNFLIIMNNSHLLRTYDYLIKSEQTFQNFILVCERDLYNFIYSKRNGMDLGNDPKEDEDKNKYDYSNDCLSDLEDQLIYGNENFNKLIHTNQIQIQINPIKDRSSNYYNIQKEYVPKYRKEVETLKEKIPLLKNFNPSYTKKVNIDKKIIRKFKNYIKEKYTHININHQFWSKFVTENLLPPFKIFENDKKSESEFKSFNSKYLVWLFSKENSTLYYEEFLNEEGKELIDGIIKDYDLHKKEKEIEQLQFYIYHLAQVFSNVNNRSGVNFNFNQLDSKSFKENSLDHTQISNSNTVKLNNTLSLNNENIILPLLSQSNLNIPLPISQETTIINTEAPLNPLSYEKVYENYLGLNKTFESSSSISKLDIFDMINESYEANRRRGEIRTRNRKNIEKKYDTDSDRSLERSRELDYIFFDSLKKSWSDSSSDKEE